MKKQTANQQLIADGFECVEPEWWCHSNLGSIVVSGERRKWLAIHKLTALGPFKTATEAVRALKAYARKY